MNDRDQRPSVPVLLKDLQAMPPLQLPHVMVFLISQRKAKALSSRLYARLDAGEKARSAGLASENLSHRFITGRAALRSILTMFEGDTLDDRPPVETAWRFGSSANGKPFVRTPKSTTRSFNLSYADDLIALAVSGEVEVGIDIEVDHEIPKDELPLHLFSSNEQRLLRTTSAQDLPSVFLRLWTLKEAIAKRTGQGFATEFSEIDTATLPVIDGLNDVADCGKAHRLLFHTCLTVEEEVIHLAISTAPQT